MRSTAGNILVTITLVAIFSPWVSPALAEDLPRIGIGIVLDGPSPDNDLSDQTAAEIRTLLDGEFDVQMKILLGEWSAASVQANTNRLLADDEIDLVIALGVLSSQIFCCIEDLPKPVIASIVIDAEIQNLPLTDGGSGVRNLNYLTFPQSVESDIKQFLDIVPFKKLAIVFNRWFIQEVRGIDEKFADLAEGLGVETVIVESADTVDATVASIPADVEAVYTAPLLHFSIEDRLRFYQLLAERRLPSFAIFGVLDVERGALAGQRDVTFYNRLARRIALNTQRILLGEDPSSLPVIIPDRQLLTINMDTVRKVDAYPPWEILAEAELLHEDPDFDRKLSLESVVALAIEANLDMRARQRQVAAGSQDIVRARSMLRPQVQASLSAVAIDPDLVSGFSAQGEITYSAALTLSQVLYSEQLLASVDIQQQLQIQRERSYEQLKLDIAAEAAVAYLNVLRSKTVERIRKNDLRVTRSNLELSRVRQGVGSAGPGEVYRWESELATDRRELIEAQSSRYQAQEALNRLLHRWQSEGFETVDLGLGDPALITSREQAYAYTASPRHTDIFSNFTIEYGLEHSPELAQVDAAIVAQERAVTSARRVYRHPTVALQGSLDHILGTSGDAGAGDETSWNVAVQGSLSLFEGGGRHADVIQAEETLAQLKLEREALAERIEQLIRSELHQTRASYAGIGLSEEAATAAGKNLEVLTDAYTRGAADILDLLDAQSAALTADLAAASALYQFFIDLVEYERAINRLDFFTSPEEDDAFFEQIEAYFREAGVKPRPRPEGGW